jgi:hypothetical protein
VSSRHVSTASDWPALTFSAALMRSESDVLDDGEHLDVQHNATNHQAGGEG